MTSPVTDGAEPAGPDRDRPPPPAPLVVSCLAGLAGLVLLAAAAVTGTTALSLAGVAAGSVSLGGALYWRSLLISSWAAQKRGRLPR